MEEPCAPPSSSAEARPPEDLAPRFSLGALVIATAIASLFLFLLLKIEIVAVMLAFAGSAVYFFLALRAKSAAIHRLATDLLFGVILPALCFVFEMSGSIV